MRMDVENRSSFSVDGTQVKEVLYVKNAVAQRVCSLISTTALLRFSTNS